MLTLGFIITAIVVFIRLNLPDTPPCTTNCTVIRGLIGSEKTAFFTDPEVRDIFAKNQIKVEVTPVGSQRMADIANEGERAKRPYDFLFPGGSAPLAQVPGIPRQYDVFTSPIAIATGQPVADALQTEGSVTKDGGYYWLDMSRYLDLVGSPKRWDQIDNSPLAARLDVLVTTSDPRDTNSASLFAGLAATVAKGGRVGSADIPAVRDRVAPIFRLQGSLDSRTEKSFDDYLDGSQNLQPPMVLIYEAQLLGLPKQELTDLRQPMVLYPKPTVLSRHTFAELRPAAKKLGELLKNNDDLRRLAAVHGFRDLNGRLGTDQPASGLPAPAKLDTRDAPDPAVLKELAEAVTAQ